MVGRRAGQVAAGLLGAVLLAPLLMSALPTCGGEDGAGARAGGRQPPASGDWTVSSSEYFSSQSLQLLGNLTVEAGAVLTFRNIKLTIGSGFDGQYHVEVRSGGELQLLDGDRNPFSPDDATVLSSSSGFSYQFWARAGSRLTIENSAVRNCGHAPGARGETAGVYVQTADCRIANSTFSSCYCGLAVDNCAPTVSACTFMQNLRHGMLVRDSTLAVADCIFDQNEVYGVSFQASQPTLKGNLFRGNKMGGVQVLSSPAVLENNVFQLNKWRAIDADKSPLVSTHDEYDDNAVALFINDSRAEVEGGLFQFNNFSLYLQDAEIALRNTSFCNTVTSDIHLARYSDRSEVQSFNSTFRTVTFADPQSVLRVLWTLRSRVVWESTGAPAPGALVRVFSNQGGSLFNITADEKGALPPLALTEYEQTKAGKVVHVPYRVGVFSGRFFNSIYINLREDQDRDLPLDDVPPRFTLASPRENLTTNRSRIDVFGTITDIYARLTMNGQEASIDPSSGNFSVPVNLCEGPNLVNATATDAVGNVFTVLRTVNRDSTPPNLTVDLPPEGLLINTTAHLLTGRTEARCYVMVNGRIAEVTPEGTFQYLLELTEGENRIAVFSADQYQNGASVNRTVVVDTIPPAVEISSPADGSWTNKATVRVSGWTELGARVSINGTPAEVVSGNFSVAVGLAEGQNTLKVEVGDRAGNWRKVDLRVNLDTSPPWVEVVFPPEGHSQSSSVLVVTGRTEPGVSITCRSGLVNLSAGGNFTVTCNLSVGPNIVLLEIRDRAGNLVRVDLAVMMDVEVDFHLTAAPPARTTAGHIWLQGTAEPGARLTVDGVNATADATGTFRFKVPLRKGANIMTLNVTDRALNLLSLGITVHRTEPPAAASPLPLAAAVLVLVALAVSVGSWALLRRGRWAAARPPPAFPLGELEGYRPILKAPDAPEEKLRCGRCLQPVEDYWTKCHSCEEPLSFDGIYGRTMESLAATRFPGEGETHLQAELLRLQEELDLLRASGEDVLRYRRELALSSQLLMRGMGLERAAARAEALGRETQERGARLRRARDEERARLEMDARSQIELLVSEAEGRLSSMRESGGAASGAERAVSLARLQLRAGNLEKALAHAQDARRLLEGREGAP